LPAHHGGPDVKPPRPQLVLPAHLPPKIHGPNPGPMPGLDPRTQ
jgi:hypothetical protein